MANSDQNPAARHVPKLSSGGAGLLDEDVGCPQCGYNLRGLGVDRVACPECGTVSDVAKLLTRKWTEPWYKAPKFTQLCLPAAWAWLACIVVFFCTALSDLIFTGTRPWALGMLSTGFCVFVWMLLMVMVWRTLDELNSALFALLAHVAVTGYIAGSAMIASGLAITIGNIYNAYDSRDKLDWLALVLSLLACIVGLALMYGSRRAERAIAGHCIRLYLRRATTS